MASTAPHPLSGFAKGSWPVPDFSLESRRPKASSTLPSLFAHRDITAASQPFRPPDEEKGRSLRSKSQANSTSALFSGSDVSNYGGGFTQLASAGGLAAEADQEGGDDDYLDSWVADGGALAADETVDEATEQVRTIDLSKDFGLERAASPPAETTREVMDWTIVLENAVMKADGDINLHDRGVTCVPDSIADLATLRSFKAAFSRTTFARAQSSPASVASFRRSFHRTSSGSISAVPTSVPVKLLLAKNQLTADSLSNALWSLPNLQVLTLRQNFIERLPEGVGQLTGLQELNVASNRLKYLPAEILLLDNLSNLALHPNPFLPAPKPATPHPSSTSTSDEHPARRKRLLSPPTVHYTIPTLKETCIRRLLTPSRPSSTTPSIKAEYDVDYVRTVLPDHLLAPFLFTFQISPPSLSFARQRHSSATSTLSLDFFVSNPSPQPFDPLSSICRSPLHTGEERVFFTPACERFEWVSETTLKPAQLRQLALKGTKGKEGEVRNIPIRWRGCTAACLDWLEEEEAQVDESEADKLVSTDT
ncbi:leucine rich repeat domain containing protein [Rhodotorula toruloides]|uniref:Leucine rich repeat domain containing protein n=1 Tax=Rhodotorula toruloides TaxID=5286 RepID=A0A511K7T8_RHOTO|nr:leucine rich repeat domain containing protein [Rhodotorula toruloides]